MGMLFVGTQLQHPRFCRGKVSPHTGAAIAMHGKKEMCWVGGPVTRGSTVRPFSATCAVARLHYAGVGKVVPHQHFPPPSPSSPTMQRGCPPQDKILPTPMLQHEASLRSTQVATLCSLEFNDVFILAH